MAVAEPITTGRPILSRAMLADKFHEMSAYMDEKCIPPGGRIIELDHRCLTLLGHECEFFEGFRIFRSDSKGGLHAHH